MGRRRIDAEWILPSLIRHLIPSNFSEQSIGIGISSTGICLLGAFIIFNSSIGLLPSGLKCFQSAGTYELTRDMPLAWLGFLFERVRSVVYLLHGLQSDYLFSKPIVSELWYGHPSLRVAG